MKVVWLGWVLNSQPLDMQSDVLLTLLWNPVTIQRLTHYIDGQNYGILCLPVLHLDFSNSSYMSDLSSNMSSSWSEIPMSSPWLTSRQWSRDLSRSISSSGLSGLISLLKFLIPVLNLPESINSKYLDMLWGLNI